MAALDSSGQAVAPPERLPCPVPGCGYTSARRENLRDHTRRSHGETLGAIEQTTQAGDFVCPTCGVSFPTRRQHGVHRAQSHGWRKDDDRDDITRTAAAIQTQRADAAARGAAS